MHLVSSASSIQRLLFSCYFLLVNMVVPTVKLNNGADMPMVGFGLWKVANDETKPLAAGALRLTSTVLKTFGLVDDVLLRPDGAKK